MLDQRLFDAGPTLKHVMSCNVMFAEPAYPSKHEALALCWQMLDRRPRRWPNIGPTSGQYLMFGEQVYLYSVCPGCLHNEDSPESLALFDSDSWQVEICWPYRVPSPVYGASLEF